MSCAVYNARCQAISKALREQVDRPIPAIELGTLAGIVGDHETKRRRVRELILALRSQGMRIVAVYRAAGAEPPGMNAGARDGDDDGASKRQNTETPKRRNEGEESG